MGHRPIAQGHGEVEPLHAFEVLRCYQVYTKGNI